MKGATPAPEWFALAEKIVNSEPVIGTYAACEWDELHDDGKAWIAAIVHEALRVAAPERKGLPDRFYGDPVTRFRAMAAAASDEPVSSAHFRMWCRIAADEIEYARRSSLPTPERDG